MTDVVDETAGPDLVTASVSGGAPRRLGTINEVDWQEFVAPSAPAMAP